MVDQHGRCVFCKKIEVLIKYEIIYCGGKQQTSHFFLIVLESQNDMKYLERISYSYLPFCAGDHF